VAFDCRFLGVIPSPLFTGNFWFIIALCDRPIFLTINFFVGLSKCGSVSCLAVFWVLVTIIDFKLITQLFRFDFVVGSFRMILVCAGSP